MLGFARRLCIPVCISAGQTCLTAYTRNFDKHAVLYHCRASFSKSQNPKPHPLHPDSVSGGRFPGAGQSGANRLLKGLLPTPRAKISRCGVSGSGVCAQRFCKASGFGYIYWVLGLT